MGINGDYKVRTMSVEELESIAIEWAAQEGWNPGLNDAEVFHATDREGFFVGILNGEPVACISAVAYNNNFGFIGFYIVKPGFRNEGYSIKLCRKALEHLGNRNIGLDGVVEQQLNYQKLGFRIAYNNIRFQGKTVQQLLKFKNIVAVNQVDIPKVADYDATLFPAPRHSFIKRWITMPMSNTFVALSNQKIEGYGTIRKCRNGYKIGPLFANKYQIAHDLLYALLGSVQADELFYLDIPDINQDAQRLVEQLGMKKVFETARMYSSQAPNIDVNRIFGITSFELG